jgi:hypothetical protein
MRRLFLVMYSLVVLVGCGSKELTRGTVTKVLNSALAEQVLDPRFPVIDLAHPTPDEFNSIVFAQSENLCLESAGIWTAWQAQAKEKDRSHIDISTKGRQLFFSASPGAYDPTILIAGPKVSTIPRVVVAVTGISDETPVGVNKVALFTWNWDVSSLPQDVKACITTSQHARNAVATFRLFDDGWRLVKVATAKQ